MLPLEVSEFGVFLGALLLMSIESTYIQYTYLISVVFQGKCFITIFVAHLCCQPHSTLHLSANDFCIQYIEFHSFNRLSLYITITVTRFVFKWIEYMKHFMSQWLSTGVGLGESHCDIKCFIYGICSSTNIITTIAIHSESRLKLWNSIFRVQKLLAERWRVEYGWQQRCATNIVIKHFPWKTTDIKYVYCMYILSMDANNNIPRNTPNSDTSKGSIMKKK
jgi:hypothetical protein